MFNTLFVVIHTPDLGKSRCDTNAGGHKFDFFLPCFRNFVPFSSY